MAYDENLANRLRKALARKKQPHTKPFDITGRPMKGWLMVEPSG